MDERIPSPPGLMRTLTMRLMTGMSTNPHCPPDTTLHAGTQGAHWQPHLRAKMSAELAKVINDGLFYYEQDLWTEKFELPEYSQIKGEPWA